MVTTIAQEKFFIPSVVDCHGFLREMKLTQDVIDKIEIATCKQPES